MVRRGIVRAVKCLEHLEKGHLGEDFARVTRSESSQID